MSYLGFKADDEFAEKLKIVANHKGITASAYMKLVLKKTVNGDLAELTENGLTVEEEQRILLAIKDPEHIGPFDDIEKAIEALKE